MLLLLLLLLWSSSSFLMLLLLSEVLANEGKPSGQKILKLLASRSFTVQGVWLGACSKKYSGAMWTIWRWCQDISVVTSALPPRYLHRDLSWCQAQPYSQELPFFLLSKWHSNTANSLSTTKPVNKGKMETLGRNRLKKLFGRLINL